MGALHGFLWVGQRGSGCGRDTTGVEATSVDNIMSSYS